MPRLHRQPPQKIRRRPPRKKEHRQPQRHHPHHRKISEIHVLNHPVAQNVQLRPHGRSHLPLPCHVPIQRIQRNRCDRQPHRRQVRPSSPPKQTHRRKSHPHPQ